MGSEPTSLLLLRLLPGLPDSGLRAIGGIVICRSGRVARRPLKRNANDFEAVEAFGIDALRPALVAGEDVLLNESCSITLAEPVCSRKLVSSLEVWPSRIECMTPKMFGTASLDPVPLTETSGVALPFDVLEDEFVDADAPEA